MNILSATLRRKEITQYLDNRKFNGFLFLNNQLKIPFDSYIKKYWFKEYQLMNNINFSKIKEQ